MFREKEEALELLKKFKESEEKKALIRAIEKELKATVVFLPVGWNNISVAAQNGDRILIYEGILPHK